MKQAHIYISGFVQGVGFRAYVRSRAKKLGLTGWIRNLQDGRVEGVFQGERQSIERLILYCKKGPFFSKPTDIVVDWEDLKEKFSDFLKRETL